MSEIETLPAVRRARAAVADVERWRDVIQQQGGYAPQYERHLRGAEDDVRTAHKALTAIATALAEPDAEWIERWAEHGRRRIARIEAEAGVPLSTAGKAEVMAAAKAELMGVRRGH